MLRRGFCVTSKIGSSRDLYNVLGEVSPWSVNLKNLHFRGISKTSQKLFGRSCRFCVLHALELFVTIFEVLKLPSREYALTHKNNTIDALLLYSVSSWIRLAETRRFSILRLAILPIRLFLCYKLCKKEIPFALVQNRSSFARFPSQTLLLDP